MEYLQYALKEEVCFYDRIVLNLIINGIPSIHSIFAKGYNRFGSFKPYYKWNTFNTGNMIKIVANSPEWF